MDFTQSEEHFYEFLERDRTVLVCFMAKWCGDCHFIEPILHEIEQNFSAQVDFLTVDIDKCPDLANAYNVKGIPSFLLFHKKQIVSSLINSRRKTKKEVEDLLQNGLALLTEE